MKNPEEVLREKELQLEAISREVEALRIVASLLVDEAEITPKMIDEAEITPKIPPQSDHATGRLEGTSGSAVTAPVKFWPY